MAYYLDFGKECWLMDEKNKINCPYYQEDNGCLNCQWFKKRYPELVRLCQNI